MTILLLDDEPAVARLYGAAIQRRGFDVRVCTEGAEALEMTRDRRFHLILSDVEMPMMTGYDFCRHLAGRGPKPCPILFLTAHDSVQSVADGLRSGADDFLLKGSDLEHFLARVTFWLTSGFKSLPRGSRDAAIDLLDTMNPIAPLLPELTLDRDLVKAVLECLHKEVQSTPPSFGTRLIDRMHLLGRATALLRSHARKPAHHLRFPDALVELISGLRLATMRDGAVLLAHFDSLANDARFREAGDHPLEPGAIHA